MDINHSKVNYYALSSRTNTYFVSVVWFVPEKGYEMNLHFCYPLPPFMIHYLISEKCRHFWTAPYNLFVECWKLFTSVKNISSISFKNVQFHYFVKSPKCLFFFWSHRAFRRLEFTSKQTATSIQFFFSQIRVDSLLTSSVLKP